MRRSARKGAGDAVDLAMRRLVALVVAEPWYVTIAARELRQAVHDDAVLRRARARVSRALAERASDIGERAAATIDAALALTPTPAIVTGDEAVPNPSTSDTTNRRRELG
jgi:hypothetical protein